MVGIREEWGVSYELGLAISSFVESFHPEHWAFLNPGIFTVCFADENLGKEKSANLLAAFPAFVAQQPEAKNLRIGYASGRATVVVGDDGKWTAVVGKTVNDALPAASKNLSS